MKTNLKSFFCIFLIAKFHLAANPLFDYIKNILPEDPIIIDCGCFDGADSISLARYWPKGQVYSFEAVPAIFEAAKKTTQFIPNIKVFPLALGDKDGTASFYVSEQVGYPGIPTLSSSALKPKYHLEKAPHIIFPACIDVQMVKLDSWGIKNGIDHIDFMWLDMQGFELNMIKASRLAQNAKVIWTEVIMCEAYEDQAQYKEMMDWMTDHDYVFIGSDFNADDTSQWYGNVLFVHKDALH